MAGTENEITGQQRVDHPLSSSTLDLNERIEEARKSMDNISSFTRNNFSSFAPKQSAEKEVIEKAPIQSIYSNDPSDSLESSGNSVPSTFRSNFKPPENWANAPEFVPRSLVSQTATKSYAEIVGSSNISPNLSSVDAQAGYSGDMCPYAMTGECRYGDSCARVHGLMCDYCGKGCLHPYDTRQRERHIKDCIEQHEKDMELSFAVAKSGEKTCGICMEVIVEKSPAGEQRFGILPSCAHCFCLSCIRRWRQARQFENKIIRACPECRITSDFVCPSRFWVETKEEKEKLIANYKIALSQKACRYYRHGVGSCPFGNKCFYLHALSNGQLVDVGPPRRQPRRQNANGNTEPSQAVSIWEFLEEWELQWIDIEDFMEMFDSDDQSEWSDDDFHS